MTNDLEQLASQFPKIFPKPVPRNHANIDQHVLPWGFECGEGWYHVIHDLCQSVMAHCNKTGERPPQACQVKEKYGGLRFYVDYASEEVYKIISSFEGYSYKVCEVCGAPGKMRDDNRWVMTRCDEHYRGNK